MSSFAHTLPRRSHHVVTDGSATTAGGREKMATAGPRLTTCQLPPCCASNPSFETFVSTRATANVTNSSSCQHHHHHNSKQQQMSVVDILRDLRSTSDSCNRMAVATAAKIASCEQPQQQRTAAVVCNSSEQLQQQLQRHGCKPVICPKAWDFP